MAACKQACKFDPLPVIIGVEKLAGKMKVSFSQSIRYIELSGSPFNADGESNLDAD
jgi:hypothetical protein